MTSWLVVISLHEKGNVLNDGSSGGGEGGWGEVRVIFRVDSGYDLLGM
jgi:hypothetical protein